MTASKSPLGFWDRVALSFAPKWGLDRLKARAIATGQATVSRRSYEAAQPGRRTDGWARIATDADLANRGAAFTLRNLARDLIRNNSWARRIQRSIANDTVGTGIVPKATGVAPDIAKRAMALWNAWAGSTECETEARHTFAGLQHLAMKSIIESGEVLFRRRARRPKDALTIPMQIQVLEADYLDQSKNLFVSLAGGPIIQGVEFDLIGRRAAYWLYDQHPLSGRNYSTSRRIPAEDVIHVYYTERPGQTRGVTWLAPIILPLKDFDEYEDASLMKQKVAAAFAGFVVDIAGEGPGIGDPDTKEPDRIEAVEPGTMSYLPAGKTVAFSDPPASGDDAFTNRTLRGIAAGGGATYEGMTGDYSQVNFSSGRMSRLAHWADVRDWQENMLIPLMCQVAWGWAMDAAVLAGELPVAPGSEWSTNPMPMIEPDKEGLAIQRLVRTGAMTLDQMVREQGGDPDAHWEEYAQGLKKIDALGIKLDSDVRAVSQAGLTQERVGLSGGRPETPETGSKEKE